MFGLLSQSYNIFFNILWRGVVVIEDGGCLIADDVPRLADLDVERENPMHEGKYEDKELVFYELADA